MQNLPFTRALSIICTTMSTIIYHDEIAGEHYPIEDSSYARHLVREGKAVLVPEGFFVDWDGNTRRTEAPGPGMSCRVYDADDYRRVDVIDREGFVTYEAVYYPTVEAIQAVGVNVNMAP